LLLYISSENSILDVTSEVPVLSNIAPLDASKTLSLVQKWKKSNNLNENITAEEAFYKFKDKYKIKNTNDVQENIFV